MKSFIQRGIMFFIVFILFSINQAALAVTDLSISDRVDLPLRDVHQAAWAEKEIREMTLRGVISGYTDGTFRPNQAVKKIDALVMAVRVLGLEKEAQKLTNQYDPQFYVFEGKGLEWAQGYLRVAYNNGLIQNYMQELNWHEHADRAWMAQLMVRLLDKDKEALEQPDYSLGFTDESQIVPRSRAKYIAVAMNNGLISGYPDRTFRPDVHMTRAELAVLLTKYYDQYVEDYSLRKVEYATIEDIDLEQLEIVVRTQDRDNNLKKYTIHRNATVFFTEDKEAVKKQLSFLERNQMISFLEHDDQILFIDVVYEGYGGSDYDYESNYDYEVEYLVGFISSISANGQKITLEDVQGKKQSFDIKDDLEITYKGRNIPAKDLKVGDLYTYHLTDNRLSIMEYQPGERTTFTGEVTTYMDYLSELHIYHEIEGSYDYQNNMKQFYLPKGIKPSVSERDYVRVFAYGNFVYDVELLRTTYMEGYFRKYDEDKHQMTILDKYGHSHTYDLASELTSDNMESFHYNDYMQLSFDSYNQINNRNPMEVLHIQVMNQLQGTIEAASYSTVTIRNEVGHSIRYSFADNPTLSIVGIRDPKRSDLRVHDQVSYRVEKGDVTSVDVYMRSEEEGTIFNLKNNQLSLADRFGQRHTYTMSSSTKVSWNDYRNLSTSELKTGQKVKLWLDGDRVTEVRLVDDGWVTGLVTDYSRDSVWLAATASDRTRFILDDDVRISSSYGNSTLEKLENRIVSLSFSDGKVISIVEEQQDEQEYTVIHINPQHKSIRVMAQDQKHYIYKLPEKVRYNDTEYDILHLSEKISTKQRVTLRIANYYVVAID